MSTPIERLHMAIDDLTIATLKRDKAAEKTEMSCKARARDSSTSIHSGCRIAVGGGSGG